MVYQVAVLFLNGFLPFAFYAFIFFSTVCSYNFHWYLTTHSATGSERLQWASKHKSLHLLLSLLGLIGAIIAFALIWQYWFWIGIGAFITFLYTAPKIPGKYFSGLRRVALGKTLFLAAAWTYITTVLPLKVAGDHWLAELGWFTAGRFFLIYCICILFDYRDREDDKADGIRSMITWFDEKGIDRLFVLSMVLFVCCSLLLLKTGFSITGLVIILIPGLALSIIYRFAKRHFSDYLYYFVLDGYMMLSAILMLFIKI
jgi:4-hydroxybenzoate polyprenyltransferase